MLPIPDQIASELGLHSGTSVEVTRTADGFEVKATQPGTRRGSDDIWRTHAERMVILNGLQGHGLRFITGSDAQVDALIKDREEDAFLDHLDEVD